MIHWVAAPDDARLEPYRHVADPGWLRERDLFVAEGRLVVARLLALGGYSLPSILVNRAAHDALLPVLASADTNVYVCDDPSLTAVTGYNFHRGCLAIVRRPAPVAVERLHEAELLLALEGVGNPDNVGGLFRSAAALGVDGVLLDPASGDPFYRKAIRTSMGAALRLPFVRVADWGGVLHDFRSRGFRIVALTPGPDAVPLSNYAATVPAARRQIVCVGAEGPGLDGATLALADARVRIPIEPVVDSLNVTVAASIALERLRSVRA
jgi:tRNA G18 (ribose-2'-O)-methylase SpoU